MAEKIIGLRIQVKGTTEQEKQMGQLEKATIDLKEQIKVLNKIYQENGSLTDRQAQKLSRLKTDLKATQNAYRDSEAAVLKQNDALRKNSGFVEGIKIATSGTIKELRAMQAQLAALKPGTEAFNNLAKRAGELKNSIDDARQSVKELSGGTNLSQISNQLQGLKGQILDLDFKGASEKAKEIAAVSKSITFAEAVSSLKNFGSTMLSLGTALLTNPIFLIAGTIGGIIYAVKQWRDIEKEKEEQIRKANAEILIGLEGRLSFEEKLSNAAGETTEQILRQRIANLKLIEAEIERQRLLAKAELAQDRSKENADEYNKLVAEGMDALEERLIAETELTAGILEEVDKRTSEQLKKQRTANKEYKQLLKDIKFEIELSSFDEDLSPIDTETVENTEANIAKIEEIMGMNIIKTEEQLDYITAYRFDQEAQLTQFIIDEEKKRADAAYLERQKLVQSSIQLTNEFGNFLRTANDAQTKNKIEALKQQGLSEEEFNKQSEAIRRQGFENWKKLEVTLASINYFAELASIARASSANPANATTYGGAGAAQFVLNAGVATARYATTLAGIQSATFARGGFLQGASHAEGGIPFTVGGKPGFEAEGGEAIINKQSTSMFKPLLSAINQAGGGVAFKKGGMVKKYKHGGLFGGTFTEIAGINDVMPTERVLSKIYDKFIIRLKKEQNIQEEQLNVPSVFSTGIGIKQIAKSSSMDIATDKITANVQSQIGAIKVVNVVTDTTAQQMSVKNTLTEATVL